MASPYKVTRIHPVTHRVAKRAGSRKSNRRSSRNSRRSTKRSTRNVRRSTKQSTRRRSTRNSSKRSTRRSTRRSTKPYLLLTKKDQSQRMSHKKKCGAKCFGKPAHLRHPLCNANCKYNCEKLHGSYGTLHANKEYALATKIYNKAVSTACNWAKKSKK